MNASTSNPETARWSTLERLMIRYLAAGVIKTAEKIEKEHWTGLAHEIRIPVEQVEQLWDGFTEGHRNRIWNEVLTQRIETAVHHPAFRQLTANRVAGRAIDKLEQMLAANLIRNPGELLAIYKTLGMQQAAPSQGANLTINMGNNSMQIGDGQTLPGEGAVMRINLNPRTAAALQGEQAVRETRIIDAEMLDVQSLRGIATHTNTTTEGTETDG